MAALTIFTSRRFAQEASLGGELVYVLSSGAITVSNRVAERLGSPERVVFLTGGDRPVLGVRAATEAEHGASYKLNRYSRSGQQANAYAALWSIGRRVRQRMIVPHSWDGAVLLIDVSELPEVRSGVRS